MSDQEERRRFSGRERTTLYLAAGGCCAKCGAELEPGWHADHVHPHSRLGKTDVINGQALCPRCNLRKGSSMEPAPREWQKRFIAKYHGNPGADFLLVACPGAGKTLASGYVARDLIRDGTAGRILVVVPTAALRPQWMKALASLGIVVDGVTMNNGQGEKATIDGQRTNGWVVTYQSLYSDRGLHRILNSRTPTLAILDEVHHLGAEASWGKAAVDALGPCVRRLSLSGTPFRGSRDEIPFVEFDSSGYARYRDDESGTPYPRGFDYSYGRALQDTPPPVRPILFDQYAGDIAWLDHWTGEEKTVNLSDPLAQKDRSKANKHALDPRGEWLRTVLTDADARLSMVRSEGDPSAQGVVLCIDTRHAYGVQKLLDEASGTRVPVAVSKDLDGRDVTEQAREVIENFGASAARWLVAVAMVSEGIDIPTLRVGVWATVVRSPLRFRQGMGRLIRRTGLPENVDQTAYMFVPKDPVMVALADGVYEEVKLALLERDDDETDGPDGPPGPDGPDELPFDAFRHAEAKDPSMHAPGLGVVDPEEAAKIARESGQSLGAVAAVIAAMAKLGMDQPAASREEAPASDPGTDIGSYPKRLKKAQGSLESLLKQLTSAWLRKNEIPYSKVNFSNAIAKIKTKVYGDAGIPKGGYERADIPQLKEAISIAKKLWAEL